ncbi:MAG TPA: hypothetical protein VNX88_02905 [Terriglobales bacterium]|nr:hypothetical protein [Terriglobales bacterium]
MNRIRGIVLAAGILCALSLFSVKLCAQGCASCYTTAAAGGPQTAHALRVGILLLVFPPTLIFAGIIIAVRRWKNAPQTLPNFTEQYCGLENSEPDVVRTE